MVDTSNKKFTPWKNGHYRAKGYPSMLHWVEGENAISYPASGKPTNLDDPGMKGTWVYGDFGETHPDVAKRTGKTEYNVEITAFAGVFKTHAVLSEDGKRLTFYGGSRAVDFFEWMSEEQVSELKESGDPVDALPNHYKIQPENQGKLLWLSGAPGLGKSVSGHILSKNADYVYYEADAFMNHLNPYIPLEADVDHSAWMAQNFLKGVSQERIDDVSLGTNDFIAMMAGKMFDLEKLCTFYSAMCADVTKEQKRIGGDWAVAQAVPTRAFRDHIRTQLGPNLIFVVLHMTKEDQLERIKNRHGDDQAFIDMMSRLYDLYEPAAEDEPNSIHLLITKDMTREDVVEKILRMVKSY